MEYITPRVPPRAQTSIVSQYGNLAHQPTMTSAGSTKMMAASVPAAEAMVWTMLFSWMVASLTLRKMAMEMTAAGMEVARSEERRVGKEGGGEGGEWWGTVRTARAGGV